jgi:hypothetical protein
MLAYRDLKHSDVDDVILTSSDGLWSKPHSHRGPGAGDSEPRKWLIDAGARGKKGVDDRVNGGALAC